MSGGKKTTSPMIGPLTEKQARRAAKRAAANQAVMPSVPASRAQTMGVPRPPARPQVGAEVGGPRQNGSQAFGLAKQQLEDVFTKQDQAILGYLDGVANPWTLEPVRAPLVVGGFALEIDCFQMDYEGEAIAGNDGVAWVEVGVSGWVSVAANTGAPLEQFEAPSGGTNGNPIIYSNSSVLPAVGFPPQGIAATGVIGSVPGRLIETAWNPSTRMRVTSVGLEIFGDSSLNNAAGKVMICSTIRPADSAFAARGALANNNFTSITTTPRKTLERAEMPLSGWVSGTVLRAFAIPGEPACFNMNEMPNNGSVLTPFGVLGAIAQGMIAGQTFSWKVVYNFEAVTEVTNKTNSPASYVVHAGGDRLVNALPHLKPFSVLGGPKLQLSRLPVAAHALVNEMALSRPSHAAALVQMAKRPQLLDALTAGAKAVLGKVADSGILNNIPLVGGFADTVAKGAKWLWNMF